jgi:hypothetical protein
VHETLGVSGTQRAEHDVGLRPATAEYPTVVVLSTWADSRSLMEWEMHQWMKNSNGKVQKAVLLTWTSLSKAEVGCTLEVFEPELVEAGEGDEDEPKILGGRKIQEEVCKTLQAFGL